MAIQTLREAVVDGFRNARAAYGGPITDQDQFIAVIEAHVQDYLRHRFQVAYLQASNNPDALEIIWKLATGLV